MSEADERLRDALDIVDELQDFTERMNPKESKFVEDMAEATFCTQPQLDWLEKIKAKYL